MTIQAGSRYRFMGLPGAKRDDRTIVIHDISTSGELSYVISMDGDERWANDMYSMPYDRFMTLLVDGIYELELEAEGSD